MTDAIIGGAIAAVIGAVGYAIVGLLLDHRREKAQKLTIVDALMVETLENLLICRAPEVRETPWTVPFKLEAYHAYKSQIFFLPKDLIESLMVTAFMMEGCNTNIQRYMSRVMSGQSATTKPTPLLSELIKRLQAIDKELRKWMDENEKRSARTRLFNLVSTRCCRLQNFVSKKRKNSKLSHS